MNNDFFFLFFSLLDAIWPKVRYINYAKEKYIRISQLIWEINHSSGPIKYWLTEAKLNVKIPINEAQLEQVQSLE